MGGRYDRGAIVIDGCVNVLFSAMSKAFMLSRRQGGWGLGSWAGTARGGRAESELHLPGPSATGVDRRVPIGGANVDRQTPGTVGF
ncbi:hypothetical protein Ate02nite_57950 [Paractinoplanes tereljensis]|uniref:Uncharacterized protein n=1 Tax=Paractinoplanes tereljensis TaxID=571912 RepID=A0A919NQ96_9ACTN|nr:hypothetical protein Ate02nite_57950 [Actinoplanes tereljensis]